MKCVSEYANLTARSAAGGRSCCYLKHIIITLLKFEIYSHVVDVVAEVILLVVTEVVVDDVVVVAAVKKIIA
jgi:hypothetical protein